MGASWRVVYFQRRRDCLGADDCIIGLEGMGQRPLAMIIVRRGIYDHAAHAQFAGLMLVSLLGGLFFQTEGFAGATF